MKLYEHEGKELLQKADIAIPKSQLVDKLPSDSQTYPLVIKAQVLSGKRGKRGLVKLVQSEKELQNWFDQYHGQTIDGEIVSSVLLEQPIEIAKELYLSITYSTTKSGPVLLFSDRGGVEIESQTEIEEIDLDFASDVPPLHLNLEMGEKQSELVEAKVWQVANQLWKLFQSRDLFLAEINPLVITTDNQVVALDAKLVSDDAANYRQDWNLPERNIMGTKKSWAEIEAEKIDQEDHRGAVGRVYLDLDGDIGVIAAGGGASLVAMDAMVSYGLKPANYTEFSGNPPEWKVKRLTEIVLAKPNLKGAILVGGKANFTDQVETLTGFVEALKVIKPTYPIIVRRDGPRMEEAKALLEEAAHKNNWGLEVYDSQISILDAVKRLVEIGEEKN